MAIVFSQCKGLGGGHMFPEGKTCPLACFEHRLDTPCVSGAGHAPGALGKYGFENADALSKPMI